VTANLALVTQTTPRKTAEERREEILEAAMIEFAEKGLYGTSTDDIARRAGVSQPYLFRLFGSKRELFKAASVRCMRETLQVFQRAAEGKRGMEALHAMGGAYGQMLADRTRLRMQMQAYVACDDPEICEVVRNGYGDIYAYVERVSGLPAADVGQFFACGMLFNVAASMNLAESGEAWAERLIGGAKEGLN
jgi:AcrR family transcriptional regulator